MDTIEVNGWYVNIDYGLGSLTYDQIISNGWKFCRELYRYRWSYNAIAGIIGNVVTESGLNPGSTESPGPWGDRMPTNAEVLAATNYWAGMGFVQWTPGRVTLVNDFAEPNGLLWYDGTTQTKCLKYEADNHIFMGMNWDWFIKSKQSPDELAEYFCLTYEHPADPEGTMAARKSAAITWYDMINGKLHRPIDIIMFSQNNRKRKELKPPCRRM